MAKSLKVDTVIIEKEKKEHIKEALSQREHYDKLFNEWGFKEVFEKGTGISMLFYGPPGTGKTMMCEAISNEVKMPMLVVSSAEIETSTPGGAERNIKKFFQMAKGEIPVQTGIGVDGVPIFGKQEEHVLVFDECDSLVSSRSKVGMIVASQINVLLQEIEHFNGVLLFTTNRLIKLDSALESRLSVKIEFPKPNKRVRKGIWKRLIPKKAPIAKDVDFNELSKLQITGRNIKNIILGAARLAVTKGDKIEMKHFIKSSEREMGAIIDFRKNE